MTTFHALTKSEFSVTLQMMKAFNAIDNYPFDAQERTENLTLLLENSTYGKLWIIRENGNAAGYAFLGFGFSFEFKGRDAFVDELFILPEFQGKGIGTRAIDFLIGESIRYGIKALHLEAERHNERALKLYRGKGFTDHNRFLLTRFI